MRNFLFGFWVVLIFTTLISCSKKEEGVVISGKLMDSNQDIEIKGVTIEVWAQKVESGIYSAHYDNYGTQITDDNGNFSFLLENQTYASVKLIFSQINYYYKEVFIDGEAIKNQYQHHDIYKMLPKAWIRFLVKNNNPVDLEDYFEFKILNGITDCELCCEEDLLIFTGMEVDEEWICQMVGHSNIDIRWNSRKEGIQKGDEKSVFLPAFDTTRVELFY